MDAMASCKAVRTHTCRAMLSTIIIMLPLTSAGAGPLRAGAVGTTAVVLTWTAPGDDGTVGAARQYDIRSDTSPITEGTWEQAARIDQVLTPRPSGAIETLLVTGLNPGTAYYFTLRSADEVPNWSSLSNVAAVATGGETIPPSRIDDLTVDSVSSTVVTLRWAAPGDDGDSGRASGYDLRYAADSLILLGWDNALRATGEPNPAEAGMLQTCTLNGLTPGGIYFFAIKSVDDAANWSPLSNVVSARCLDTAMLPAANFTGNPTTGPASLTVDFVDGSLCATSWSWDFGDGGSSTVQHPRHVFAAAGTYTIKLIAQNIYGADQTIKTGYIVVSEPPHNLLHIGAMRFTKESWSVFWRATIKALVLDELGRAVAGAVVTGQWSGGATGIGQATTGSDGWCTVRGKWRRGTAGVAFCVTRIDKSGWTYDAQANTVVCVESNPVALGNLVLVDSAETEQSRMELDPSLVMNYPNPFNALTAISFSVANGVQATIDVYNLLGQRVRRLAEGPFSAGTHNVLWDGNDDYGRVVASGVYLYRITCHGGSSIVKKMVLVR